MICSLPEELKSGMQQFEKHFRLPQVTLNAKKGKNSVSLKHNICDITYTDKVYFFRALGFLAGNADGGFLICENKKIENLGVQLDLSRNGALTVEAIKSFMDYMAYMGMNKLYLYMEDMFEVPGRKHFGYLRGRYTKDELKEIDDYGFNYGIEVIPGIQCLGHHFQYLKWKESADIKDTNSELLCGGNKTYEFIEQMIKSVLSSFRTNKIILGMDEARTLGLGNYLKKNGYEKPENIFMKHIQRVFEITGKLGVSGLIYSDMFFDISSEKHYYYDKDAVISKHLAEKLPENASLIYWHYGEEYGCDEYMIKKHKVFGKKPIFFGGSWTWSGHLPETAYAINCIKQALQACEKNDIDEAVITIWGDDGNECNHFYSLLTLCYEAEYIYGNAESYKSRFYKMTGADAQAFYDMSAYQNIPEIEYGKFTERFKGKALFWQDILSGQADAYLKANPMSGHYRKYADKFREYTEQAGVWKEHFEYIYSVFKLMELKCYIAENLQSAYKDNNKKLLGRIVEFIGKDLYEAVDNCHRLHKKIWFFYYKPFGWEVIDIRYGGLKSRIKTAEERLNKYLCGEIKIIEELEEERLGYDFSPFIPYREIAAATYVF